MMAATTVKFEGGVELERALQELGKATTARAVARRALKSAAEPILRDWNSGTAVLTGALRDSEIIGTRLNKRQRKFNREAAKGAVEVHVGTNDPAGLQEEFGNRHQAANPSLRAAWAAQGGETALARIGEDLGSEIERQRVRLAAKAAKRAR